MKSANPVKPTDKELEILQVLWDKGPASVKDVHQELGGEEKNGYTTILKLMQIMHEKGIVERQKNGKHHLYRPLISEEITRQVMVDKIVSKVFKGSTSQLIISALGNGKSSREELDKIRHYLDNLDKEKA
jgi:BlaI family transcriptional regulator, penicillinase repressor